MKRVAVAIDYDGTIDVDSAFDPLVRDAHCANAPHAAPCVAQEYPVRRIFVLITTISQEPTPLGLTHVDTLDAAR